MVDPVDKCLVCEREQRPCVYVLTYPWPFDSSARVFPLAAVLEDGRCQAVLVDKEELGNRPTLHFDLAEGSLEKSWICSDVFLADQMELENCQAKHEREKAAATARPQNDHFEYSDRSGMGEMAFWGAVSRLVSFGLMSLVPEYAFSFGRDRKQHGLLWELAFEFATGDRPALGHTVWTSLAWYPRDGHLLVGRAGYRFWPVYEDVFEIGFGAGIWLDESRAGPVLDLRLRLSPLGGGSSLPKLFFGAAYEPDLRSQRHFGSLFVGMEAPWKF